MAVSFVVISDHSGENWCCSSKP